MSATAVMTESMMAMSVPTATPEATAVADTSNQAQMRLKATPEPTQLLLDQQAAPAAEQPAQANLVEVPPTIDPLRIVEIALLALAIVLGIATLAARRKQT